MIFNRRADDTEYHRWFAWYPVKLNGPDEWERCRARRTEPRVVWLGYVQRMRVRPNTYYFAEEDSR